MAMEALAAGVQERGHQANMRAGRYDDFGHGGALLENLGAMEQGVEKAVPWAGSWVAMKGRELPARWRRRPPVVAARREEEQ